MYDYSFGVSSEFNTKAESDFTKIYFLKNLLKKTRKKKRKENTHTHTQYFGCILKHDENWFLKLVAVALWYTQYKYLSSYPELCQAFSCKQTSVSPARPVRVLENLQLQCSAKVLDQRQRGISEMVKITASVLNTYTTRNVQLASTLEVSRPEVQSLVISSRAEIQRPNNGLRQ